MSSGIYTAFDKYLKCKCCVNEQRLFIALWDLQLWQQSGKH